MEITCPHCNFSGTIQDDLIPESGSAVSCPKCKKKFFVAPDIPVMEADEMTDVNASSSAAGPDTSNLASSNKKMPGKRDTVKTLFVAFGLIFGMFLCFIAGRLSVQSNPLSPAPSTPAKPASPAAPTKTTEGSPAVEGLAGDLPLIIVPEGRFFGTETVDVVTIDREISGFSALADPDKKAKMRELAKGLVGMNLSGTYLIRRIESVVFFFDTLLPGNGESRYIEAEADTKSPVHARIFLTPSGKDTDIAAIEKAKKVFVKGFVVSCRISDGLEIGLTNAQIRAVK
jgi:predicted Zn finger-like uncharacterized protein